MKRILARMTHQQHTVCFACGKPADLPCASHPAGGVITGWRVRRWTPSWLAGLVDCRWTLPRT